ncbi:MAG: MFS transporter [Candidatus Eisenbacteria bacterium]
MSGAAPTTTPAPRSFRTFLVLWASQTLSLFGTFVTQFAVNIWLTVERYPRPEQKPQLALALTACTIASTLPAIFFLPLAGAFADRHDRRRILVVANAVSAALTVLLVALHFAGRLELPAAVLLLAAYAFTGSFHSSAFDSGYLLLVEPAQRGRATGMVQTSFALSQVLSPALAATLVGLPALLRGGGAPVPAWLVSGVPFAFAADGVTFVIGALAVAALRFPPAPPRTKSGASVFHDAIEGLTWIVRRRPLVELIQFGSLVNFAIAPLVLLTPLLVRDRLAADCARRHLSYEAALALVNSLMGIGGVVGGVLMTTWGGLRGRRVLGLVGSIALVGLGQAAVGLSPTVVLFGAACFATGVLTPLLNSHSMLLWQEITPPERLARALSSRRFISQIAFPLGTLVAGWLAVRFEPWLVVTLAGATITVVSGARMLTPGFATLEARMRASAAE